MEALTALDEGRDPFEVAKLASLAKAKVGETYGLVSREGIQMHGGIGMTDEFEIGFFIKAWRLRNRHSGTLTITEIVTASWKAIDPVALNQAQGEKSSNEASFWLTNL